MARQTNTMLRLIAIGKGSFAVLQRRRNEILCATPDIDLAELWSLRLRR